MHGADVITYHEVVDFVRTGNRIEGIVMRDVKTGEQSKAYADVVVNAGGIWGHLIAKLAGVTVNMFPAKGALLIFGHRVNNMVINRCRKPANADILVPGDTICLIGTTSDRIPFDQIDNMFVTPEEVDVLIREGEKLAPSLAILAYFEPMQVFVRWLHLTMTPQAVQSAVVLFVWTTQFVMGWKASLPSPVVN
jgi:glycerol-3-phosphate dehydrogenase